MRLHQPGSLLSVLGLLISVQCNDHQLVKVRQLYDKVRSNIQTTLASSGVRAQRSNSDSSPALLSFSKRSSSSSSSHHNQRGKREGISFEIQKSTELHPPRYIPPTTDKGSGEAYRAEESRWIAGPPPPPSPSLHRYYFTRPPQPSWWGWKPRAAGTPGWGWSETSGWGEQPQVIHVTGWGWSSHPKQQGWSWGQPQQHGWGWTTPSPGWGWSTTPKCDPNRAEAHFQFDSVDDIPKDARVYDGFNRSASIEDLHRERVPSPPLSFSLGARSSTPTGYTPVLTLTYDVALNTDGTTSVDKEVRSGAAAAATATAADTSSLPRENSYRITASLAKSPFYSVPIEGKESAQFDTALRNREAAFKDKLGSASSSFSTQMDELLFLFRELEEIPNDSEALPQFTLMYQKYSIPEPNSSETAVLDAAFNFGPQAYRVSFGDLQLIKESWMDGLKKKAGTGTGGPNQQQLQLQPGALEDDEIRAYIKGLRDATTAVYDPLEERSYELFEQHQYFIQIPGECVQPVDPQKGAGATSNICTVGRPNLRAKRAPCFPPIRC